jgi:hypothetical protein
MSTPKDKLNLEIPSFDHISPAWRVVMPCVVPLAKPDYIQRTAVVLVMRHDEIRAVPSRMSAGAGHQGSLFDGSAYCDMSFYLLWMVFVAHWMVPMILTGVLSATLFTPGMRTSCAGFVELSDPLFTMAYRADQSHKRGRLTT